MPDAELSPLEPDRGAVYAATRPVDLADVSPMVALPGTVINNAGPVGDVAGTKIDQAFIGSCANGQLADLEIAARILQGTAGRVLHPADRDPRQPADLPRGFTSRLPR